MVEMHAVCPLYVEGREVPAGAGFKVDALSARQILATGRARLVSPADGDLIDAAEREHTRRVCQRLTAHFSNKVG